MLSLKLSICVFAMLCALGSRAQLSEDEMSLTKLGANSGPTLKFYYCYSCGYKRLFEDYVNILHQKYPELQIDGENYNPPGYSLWIAKFLGTAKILVIVLIISGVNNAAARTAAAQMVAVVHRQSPLRVYHDFLHV